MKIPVSKNYLIYFGLMILGAAGLLFATFMPMPQGFYAFIGIAGLAGFGVASYIAYTKSGGGELICPTGSNCNVVVNSRYSKFMSIKLEYMGMLYYGLIFLIYLALTFIPLSNFSDDVILGILLFTAGAGLFSCYLLFVQGFLLRAWCIWCLLASSLSLIIFILSFISLPAFVDFLVNLGPIVSAAHSLGFALGLGGSTAGAYLFIRFLRDFNIDDEEMNSLQGVSEMVWLGLALALLSQMAFYVMEIGDFFGQVGFLVQSPTFFIQTVALFMAAISGAVLLIIFAPFLVAMPFKKKEEVESEEVKPSFLEGIRKIVFINGAIALSSWYFAFTMDFIPEIDLPTLFITYIIVLIAAMSISMWMESRVSKGKVI